MAAVLGGVAWAVRAVLDGASPGGFLDALFFVVPLLLLAGLAGFYARCGGRIEGVGSTGFAQGFIGLGLLVAGGLADLTLGVERADRISSFGFLILAFGMLLVGFATLKVEPLPRWNVLPLLIGGLIPLGILTGEVALLRVAFSALFGLCWAMLGYVLWTAEGEPPTSS